jgi:hypothetical protein
MKSLISVIAAVLLAAPLTAHAQHVNVAALEPHANVVAVTTGAEHGLMLGMGYGRVVDVADRPILLGAHLNLGWAEVDISDFQLRAGALAPIVGSRHWKLIGSATATLRGTENDIARMTTAGADVSLLAGRYSPRWFIAGELGFDWAMATHIEHDDAYRMNVYADARDGWYANPGGMIRAGLQSGLSLGRHDLILRAGRVVDVAGKPAMFPVYGTLTFDTRW